MQMRGNGPWGFAPAPQLCNPFFKELVGGFWGKLWISIVSHGFSVWSWQNNYVLANHLLHLCWVSYGGVKGGDVTIGQVHPW
jgi:hypothetical protein